MAFEALDRPTLTAASSFVRTLHAAARKRVGLTSRTSAWRLHDGDDDEIEGLTVERFGDFAVLSAYSRQVHERRLEWASALLELGARGVYYKQRVRADLRRERQSDLAPSRPIAGVPHDTELEVSEDARRFLVRLGDGLSTGLFVDQRDNRQYLQAHCRGARVLNLFSYTCSFSVAAGLGEAQQVTSIDLSRPFLMRGDANLRLNGLDAAQHRLLKADARKWLDRAVRRPERYDWVILDPPSFASVGKTAFSVQADYAQMVERCAHILAPGGRLLAVVNHRGTSNADLQTMLQQGAQAAQRGVVSLKVMKGAEDCVAHGLHATKSVLLTLGSNV